jgi:glutamyl-tRNA reductase
VLGRLPATFASSLKMNTDITDIARFYSIGINYKKTDASVRGLFAINNDQYGQLLLTAPKHGLKDLFILSTCNRTEIYGFADNAHQLMALISEHNGENVEVFSDMAYVKSGWKAVNHLFSVSAGIDSQILGDYEILGQIKTAAKFAKEHGFMGALTERLVNTALQSSKAVKTHTSLSGGTVSVSFAAIQYIKEHVLNATGKKVLLLGTGKIGRNTCKNLVDYLGAKNITLINRTEEKAAKLAIDMNLRSAAFETLPAEIDAADIILVATNAPEPTILASHLVGKGDKTIIDLSMPCNVAKDAQQLPNVTFADVDTLSKIKDETLKKRRKELPKANTIIEEHINDFKEWYEMRKHVPVLKEVKNKLTELNTTMTTVADPDEKIQKVINTLATKMRRKNTVGCNYIEAINDFIG